MGKEERVALDGTLAAEARIYQESREVLNWNLYDWMDDLMSPEFELRGNRLTVRIACVKTLLEPVMFALYWAEHDTVVKRYAYQRENSFQVDVEGELRDYSCYCFCRSPRRTLVSKQREMEQQVKILPDSEEKPMLDINQFHFRADVSNHVLTYRCVSAPETDESVQFAFYVKCNGEIIHKTAYSREAALQYRMEREGHYQVVFFAKQAENVSLKESEFIPFFSHTAILSGPAELTAIAAERGVTAEGKPAFILLDCLEMAERWTDKIFSEEQPDAQRTREMRQEMEALLGTFPNVPAYWFRWSLWPGRESLRKLHWTLEELYDVCRRSGRMTQELSVIVAKASDSSCTPPESASVAAALYGEFHDAIAERTQQAAERFRNQGMDFMRVTLERDGERLTAKILYDSPMEGDKYAFYLLRDNQRVNVAEYASETSHTWNIGQEGLYFVQAHISRGNYQALAQSAPVFCADGTKFQAFMNNWEYACPGKLSSALEAPDLEEPFCNILVVSCNRTRTWKTALPLVGALEGTNETLRVYSSSSPAVKDGTSMLLSGRLFLNERLCYGTRELEKLPDKITNLSEQYGDGVYCVWDSERAELGADYFAFKHWFYYRDETLTAVSNYYHTLLAGLKENGVTLKLDTDKAALLLSSCAIHMLRQNFTRRMDMVGVMQLNADQRMVWDKNGWAFQETDCGAALKKKRAYHEQDYRRLLEESKEELLKNARAILRDKRFQEIETDLSGGIDSRIVYSIMTNLPESKDRIHINIEDSGNDDLQIGVSLNGMYRYPYADYEQRRSPISLKKADSLGRYFYLGTEYSHRAHLFQRVEPMRIHITGGNGEAITRPYYSRNFLRLPSVHTERAFSELFYRRSAYLMVVDGEAINPLMQKYLGEELEKIPGDTPYERIERLRLFYDNSYHFGDNTFVALAAGLRRVVLLQSRKLLELHHLCFEAHRSIRMALDILYCLNPLAASLPFDSLSHNNEAREALREKLAIGSPCFRDLTLNLIPDMAAWEKAKKLKSGRVRYLSPPDRNQDNLTEIFYGELLRHFWRLMNMEPELRERVGPALYHYFTLIRNQGEQIRFWYNKVTSLMDQAQMFRDETSAGNGQAPGAPTLSIFGSCVSRDALEYDTRRDLKLNEYIGRQSVFSAVSPPVPPGRISIRNPSPFRQKAVERDLNKTAFRLLSENMSDFLLIDLIDERFDLLSLCDTLITGSNEFFESADKEYQKTPARKLNIKDGKLYLGRECVETDLKRFCSITLTLYRPERIILHKARMLNQYIAKDGEIRSFHPAQLAVNRKFNAVMDTVFQRMTQYFPGAHIIDELNGMLACEDNKWGLAPMHYQPEYYQRVLKRLREIMIEGKD